MTAMAATIVTGMIVTAIGKTAVAATMGMIVMTATASRAATAIGKTMEAAAMRTAATIVAAIPAGLSSAISVA